MQVNDKDNPILEVSNISFGYNGNLVLDNVSFTIKKGSYIGIIGPNGGGKTTLLKIMLGLIKPKKGAVKIQGIDIVSYPKKYEIGYVPQRASQEIFNFPVTVYEVVSSGRTPMKSWLQRFNEKDRQAINQAMQAAKVKEFENKLIGELSGGERQRVYVARALAADPKVLLLDEPFVGIDLASQEDFYRFLKELNEKQGLTVLFVSHDVDIISHEAKEILCLNRRLVCRGRSHDVLESNMIEALYGKKITHIHHD